MLQKNTATGSVQAIHSNMLVSFRLTAKPQTRPIAKPLAM